MRSRKGTRRGERGAVMAAALILMFILVGVGGLAALAGYTNLITATNLRAVGGAHASADANVNEALYRLSLPDTDPLAIVPVVTDPNWHLDIRYTHADTDPSDNTLSTIQDSHQWPQGYDPAVPAAHLSFKKNAAGTVVFFNRDIQSPASPFMSVALPNPVGPIVGNVYEMLCFAPVLGAPLGTVLGVCPANVSVTGYPVIQIHATGFGVRNARRDVLAETARTLEYTPIAPLMAGGDVNLNNAGFIDGVNHHYGIYLTAGGGVADAYGDNDAETSDSMTLAGLPLAIKDSPDDDNQWLGGPLITGPIWHGVANATLVLYFQLAPSYTAFPRLFDKQLSTTDTTAAWVGVGLLTSALTAALRLPSGAIVPAAQLGIWSGVNYGYSAAIALSPTATITNAPVPPAGNPIVWNKGVFSWRVNDKNDPVNFAGSVGLPAAIPAANTVVECGPTAVGLPPPLVCRPAGLRTFPSFGDYLGIADTTLQDHLHDPDTDRAGLDAGHAPLGFTYVDGAYTLGTATASPGTNQFGTMYVHGDLTVAGRHTYKGFIYVDGNMTVADGGDLTVLGAVMVRGRYTNAGTGHMTLLYSREAALRGLVTTQPWRILSWEDTALQQ